MPFYVFQFTCLENWLLFLHLTRNYSWSILYSIEGEVSGFEKQAFLGCLWLSVEMIFYWNKFFHKDA